MKSNLRSEFDLISRIRGSAQRIPASLLSRIGDDCAVFAPNFADSLQVSADLLIENVHFKQNWIGPYFLGRKSLLVNLSDLAAMGARPYACLLSLGLPGSLTGSYFESFVRGFLEECDRFDMPLIGGDLSRSETVVVAVTVIGTIASGSPLYRSGARKGDSIILVGAVGTSQLGLQKIRERSLEGLEKVADLRALERWAGAPHVYEQVRAHLLPEIHIEVAMWLRERGLANSMIDVSDGLGCDLLHILEESNCSADVRIEDIPLPPGVDCFSTVSRELVLNGGEDYALLFTASQEQVRILGENYPASYPPYHLIGNIQSGEVELRLLSSSGAEVYLRKGFDHFL